MFKQTFSFEWRYFSRQPSFFVISALVFSFGFLATSVNRVSMGGANLLKNGPYALAQVSLVLGLLFLFFIVNFIANTALRNEASRTTEILYSLPISPLSYNLGRFCGSFSVVLAVFATFPLGLFLGSLMPWVDPARIGPHRIGLYVSSFVFLSLPTLFTFSAVFYGLARRFRTMTAVYFAVLVIIILYEISDGFLRSPDGNQIAALLDPFCLRTFETVSRYWTIFEKNTKALAMGGLLLQNRLLWMTMGGLTLVLFGGFNRQFAFRQARLKPSKQPLSQVAPAHDFGWSLPAVMRSKGAGDLRILVSRTWFELRQTLLGPSFMLLLLITITFFILLFLEPTEWYGTPAWPLTMRMVSALENSMPLFVNITIAYYCAETIWRELQLGMDEIIGSYPIRNWGFWFSKLFAIWALLLVITLVAMACAIAFQMFHGYFRLELSQYLTRLLFFSLLPWMMVVVLAFFLAVLSPNKYVAILGFVIFLLFGFALHAIGFDSHLLHFSKSPAFHYSDMNGYGDGLIRQGWFMLYWGGLTIALCWLGFALWQRGPQPALPTRLRGLRTQLGTGARRTLTVGLTVFLASGAYIYFNTQILNSAKPELLQTKNRVQYEKKYSAFANAPIPYITKINCTVDIYPQDRKIIARADFLIKNATNQAIDRFLISMPLFTPEYAVQIDGGHLQEMDGPFLTHWFIFGEPLPPGATRKGSFQIVRQQQGFGDGVDDVQVVKNGTFINNFELFPTFGYRNDIPLTEPHARQNQGLTPAKGAHDLEDHRFYNQHFIGSQVSFIDFEATISTTPDQIALAPGYLQKTWTRNQRRYFHYKMDAPMINFYAFTSARLAIEKTQHHGIAIEVYYHPDHGANVASMVSAVRDSLDYYSAQFGPYQHRQVRIIEFPKYRGFAQSFANTIPFTEMGFLFDLRNPKNVNPIYKTTAHEIAHQWWGHQVGAADVQGSNVILESLSQYSALMVLEKKFGPTKLRRYLKYELDGYLRGRTREPNEELPLMRAENQPYIYYQKGSIAMMAIRDLLGESRLNQALKAFLDHFKYQTNPYPTTLDLKAYLDQVAEASEREVIADIFERILLYDLQLTHGEIQARSDGKFQVTLTIQAQRFQADGQGRETPITMDEPIDIALFKTDPGVVHQGAPPIYFQKHRLTQGENILKIIVATRPNFAGVDPFIKRIDRTSDDNIIQF